MCKLSWSMSSIMLLIVCIIIIVCFTLPDIFEAAETKAPSIPPMDP